MTQGYQETYLNKARSVMGNAFDYAISDCGIPGNDFVRMLSASSVSKKLENGEPAYLSGRSGIDIVWEVLAEAKGVRPDKEPVVKMERTADYWIGWAVSYYQWHSGRKYGEIFKALPYETLNKMYYTLHEADIQKFVEVADSKMREFFSDTNLKRIRVYYGVTQQELAKRYGVSLRSIQMYEQRNKNINKASAETLYQLSKVLGCAMEDLIER
ncbi:MAG: helix-turn-helix domain-containing protein [Pseudobutyrivibrio sp.]|nr:helix-turn-helix domain-containing protein [Pseudobutyrivibrio sp.]